MALWQKIKDAGNWIWNHKKYTIFIPAATVVALYAAQSANTKISHPRASPNLTLVGYIEKDRMLGSVAINNNPTYGVHENKIFAEIKLTEGLPFGLGVSPTGDDWTATIYISETVYNMLKKGTKLNKLVNYYKNVKDSINLIRCSHDKGPLSQNKVFYGSGSGDKTDNPAARLSQDEESRIIEKYMPYLREKFMTSTLPPLGTLPPDTYQGHKTTMMRSLDEKL